MLELVDDNTIPDNGYVLRRIMPKKDHYVFDEKLDRFRPTSAAFAESKDENGNLKGMSVHFLDEILKDGLKPDIVLVGYEEYFLVKLNAGELRKLGLIITDTSTPEDPYHKDVKYPSDVSRNKCKRLQKSVSKIAEWVISPKYDEL